MKIKKRIDFKYFLGLTFLLIFFSLFFSIKSMGHEKNYFDNFSYEKEEAYIRDLKAELEAMHIKNPGITVSVVSPDGLNYEYAVEIYTGPSLYSKEEILSRLEAVDFNIENSGISIILN